MGGCVVGEVVIGWEGESGVDVRLGDEGVGIEGIRLEREGGRVAVQSCWMVVERIRRREGVVEDWERWVLLHMLQRLASPSPSWRRAAGSYRDAARMQVCRLHHVIYCTGIS